ncbi:type VI secretion system membrane subunit TssM [Azospirillum sp. RWY-5-1]|uniref:Type VI secretion system membrane subunit TssM n=1 Tax=Azospirillum oleiclasticum TaxID=2735135 RepID=A0ABX2TJP6_9PROT|nr:type VI secretion system membrane subunit TssM [Azospirillum oleiclasticum]NYZ16706.1 type VI secretion system membrane subunit TssM [Azospirillum oleiclasticum]NYZ23392.1 type VI secretion system membrane subunit TssM [Azospirillum oleiclasticum]
MARKTRNPMDRLTATPRMRWLVTLAGALALALLGWHLGPLLSVGGFRPLEDPFSRAMPGLAALAGWVLLNRRADRHDRRANRRLIEALATHDDPDLRASVDELDGVRERAEDALKRLRTQRFGSRWTGRYAYQLPWYLVIGAPGSGKTTAIAEAGLATSAVAGGRPVQGMGGTRTCDWWFTDRAVLIDTAGRYTTQDSRAAVDGRVWNGLLDILREHRPRQPINGVIVTISLADLATWSHAERRAQALALRQRLGELRRHLGLRLPVYALCTKADLVAGFAAFFDFLPQEERDQVWGASFATDDRRAAMASGTSARASGRVAGPVAERVRGAMAGLLRRLDERMFERLHQEPDQERRSAAFGFPAQLSALEGPLEELLATACEPEPGEEAVMLRGVYFTSARQGGPAVDRVVTGLAALAPAAQEPVETGSFFLRRLLPEVVFPEANLAGLDRETARRRRLADGLALGGTLAAALAFALFWTVSFQGNAALIARADAAVTAAETRLKALDTPPRSLTRVEDTDFAGILPALDALRTLPMGWTERTDWPPVELTGGLYQGKRIGRSAEAVYRRALRSVFLSRVVLRLEERLRTGWARPDELVLTLRAYRMIGGREPLDRAYLAEWLAGDWQRTLPGAENEGRRRALGDHLAALFEVGFAPIPVDDLLADRVRQVIEQASARRPS